MLKEALFTIAISLVLMSANPVHAQNCSNATLHGRYAFTIHGAILVGPAAGSVNGIALSVFNGDGNMEQVDAVSHNGIVTQVWRPGTATYTVNPDCTGTMTLTAVGSPPLDLAFVIGEQGKQIHTVVTNPGFAISSDAVRQ
jgi:hypothetical protein